MQAVEEKRKRQDLADRLTEREFCAEYRISREACLKHRLDPNDPLPHLRFGRRIIYVRADVERWAARRAGKRRGRA
jgi:hypothetical protein